MRFLLLVCSWLVTISAVSIGQSPRGNSTGPEIPTLPYKLVEWPTAPISAAGVPGAWNFIQVASVAMTARGTILVLHRGRVHEEGTHTELLRSGGLYAKLHEYHAQGTFAPRDELV